MADSAHPTARRRTDRGGEGASAHDDGAVGREQDRPASIRPDGYQGQLTEFSFRRAIERAVGVGLAACDLEGRQTYVNGTFCDLVGWGEEDLVGAKPPFRYWPDEQLDEIEEAFRLTLCGEVPAGGFDLRFRRSTGDLIDVKVAVAPLVADDGSTLGWLASVTDMTDQKRIQAALRESERQLMFTLEAARVGTWDWDLTTDEVYWSENLEAVHGMPQGAFGSDFGSFLVDIRPDHRERVQSVISRTLESGSEYQIEYPVVPKEGRTIWVEGRGRVIRDPDGRPVRMAGICMDITDRKVAEAEVRRLNRDLKLRVRDLKEAQEKLRELNETLESRVRLRTTELEETNKKLKVEVAERTRAEANLERLNTELRCSNRELRDFVNAASHDLKEPLRKITYFVDLMNVDMADLVRASGIDYVERIQQSAQRMTELIDDLLTYAQLRHQERPIEPLRLSDVVAEAVVDLADQIEQEDGDVTVGALPEIEGDPMQLRQLFHHLISNGLKFRREGVPPVVRVACTTGESGERVCRIMVSDNGIGLDEKFVDRIFVPFQRLHDQREYPGSGMGLAICRRIVERHGGEITAMGTLGRGATFIVTLPVRQRPLDGETETATA